MTVVIDQATLNQLQNDATGATLIRLELEEPLGVRTTVAVARPTGWQWQQT